MIAKISSRAVISLKDIIDLAFDAHHIHLFDGYTEATILERDEGYEVIPENAEGSAFVPPTPQEMRAQIDSARIVTKEMKAQMKKDQRMAKRTEAAAQKAAAQQAQKAASEQTAEAPAEEKPDDDKKDAE